MINLVFSQTDVMRNFMRLFSIITSTLVLFVSCQDRQENKVTMPHDTVVIEQSDTLVKISKPLFNFDTLIFKKSFDSLVSRITDIQLKTSLQIDTIKSMGDFNFYPFVDSAIYTIKYRFRPPKPHGLLSITIYESFFKDSLTAEKQFKRTKVAGGREGLADQNVPGLSYAFDFVIKYKDKIIALNAPCSYADKSYRKLLPLFKHSFKIELPADTISCKCGWFCNE